MNICSVSNGCATRAPHCDDERHHRRLPRETEQILRKRSICSRKFSTIRSLVSNTRPAQYAALDFQDQIPEEEKTAASRWSRSGSGQFRCGGMPISSGIEEVNVEARYEALNQWMDAPRATAPSLSRTMALPGIRPQRTDRTYLNIRVRAGRLRSRRECGCALMDPQA